MTMECTGWTGWCEGLRCSRLEASLGLLLVIVENTDQGKNGVLGQKEMKLRFEPSDPSEEAAPPFKFSVILLGCFVASLTPGRS